MSPSHPSSPKKLRIGVLLEAVQLSDIIGIDILGNLSQSYMSLVKSIGQEWAALAPHAIDMEFFFIATTLDPAEVTPGLRVVPTVTYDDCPRNRTSNSSCLYPLSATSGAVGSIVLPNYSRHTPIRRIIADIVG